MSISTYGNIACLAPIMATTPNVLSDTVVDGFRIAGCPNVIEPWYRLHRKRTLVHGNLRPPT